MRKSISVVNENRVQLKTKVPNLRDKSEKHLILTICDQDRSIQSLIEYIKYLANIGHSFNIEVDPDDKEFHRSFSIDGDGTDHIYDVTIHEFE